MEIIKTFESFNEDLAFNRALDKAMNENEELGITALIGTLLASGKFLELLGKLSKWVYNKLVEKQLINGKKIDKTAFEKAGEWVNKLIHNVFKVAAKGIGKVFNLSNDHIEQLSHILFYSTLLVFGVDGVLELASGQGGVIATIIEQIAVLIKGMEIGEVLMALFLMWSYDELKQQKLDKVAHTMVSCLGNESVSKMYKKEGFSKIADCTIKKIKSH
jgi:hypothetical protein